MLALSTPPTYPSFLYRKIGIATPNLILAFAFILTSGSTVLSAQTPLPTPFSKH
ncbi:unnamed protein product [Fusarium venenatum]|uniref:Uncharacterized protein n=1 Tax=Fusarium venenatum TaxID=56646 RepID=A0A2L2T307_9HYPO|nr:uncharacterized protein FVRRES_13244 [Fusarium venenatum]CEI40720.1 unnamed protein product [Fusarium venenatum]